MKYILSNDKIIWSLVTVALIIVCAFQNLKDSSVFYDMLAISFLYPTIQFLYLTLRKSSNTEALKSAYSYTFLGIALSGAALLSDSVAFYFFDLTLWSIVIVSFLSHQFYQTYKIYFRD